MNEIEILAKAAHIVELFAEANHNNKDFQAVSKFLNDLAKVYNDVCKEKASIQ